MHSTQNAIMTFSILNGGIYDEENNSWGSQAIHPAELTFFGIEGRFLVDADGNPVFDTKI